MSVGGGEAEPALVGRESRGEGGGAAIFNGASCTLVCGRRQCFDGKYSKHRVSSVEGSLRAVQEIKPADVGEREIVAVLVQNRHVIHIESDDRIVHSGAKPADVDRRCHRSAVIRHVQSRNHG